MAREEIDARFPVFVTLGVLPHVWDLTSSRNFRVVSGALAGASDRLGLRVCEYRVQDRRLYLLVEARNSRSLARGMQGLSIRVAKALNRLMSKKGKVFSDRYDARILRTAAERRDALRSLRGRSRQQS